MGTVYFSLLFFILTVFIFIQLIPIYGEIILPRLDTSDIFEDKSQSSVSGKPVHSVENPNQKLIINQQNNVGFEVCTGSEPSFTCNIQEGDTLTFTWNLLLRNDFSKSSIQL